MNYYEFDEKTPTSLCIIMGRNKSDKGNISIKTSWHNYTTFYDSIFNDIKDNNLRIFELGLGTNNISIQSNMGKDGRPGASLYGWSEYFVNSNIFGADIDKEILFSTDKIKTFYCDQTKPEEIKNMWMEEELQENFNIIIEDGLHQFDANVCFLENSIEKVKPGGYYIIEDIATNSLNRWEQYIDSIKKQHNNMEFTLLSIPSQINRIDNNLLIIKKLN
jgi:hypothetical protein